MCDLCFTKLIHFFFLRSILARFSIKVALIIHAKNDIDILQLFTVLLITVEDFMDLITLAPVRFST